jgi:DNA-binding NtrC family response regulator
MEGPTDNLEITSSPLLEAVVVRARRDGQEVGSCTLSASGVSEITVGSEKKCELCLPHAGVSRRHLVLALTDRGVRARDLGSTNGTLFQGSRLSDAVLPVGAAVMVGKVELRVEAVTGGPLAQLGEFSTRSPLMASVMNTLGRAAKTDVTVLMEGETGTGKDVLARAIHSLSPRREQRFEVIDCGALPRELAAAELFGHERGAFTGAERTRAGAFERANGGTLFLDEVGELPLELQPLLLRALEAREVKHVGGASFFRVDVRVVAATCRELDAEALAGRFRADLLQRLAVVRVRVPRLADRAEDVPLLAQAIVDSLGARAAGLSLPEETLERLKRQPWPGNVRELKNFIERAIALGDDSQLTPGNSPRLAPWPEDYRLAREQVLEMFERDFAAHMLSRANGNVTRAAKEAGIGRGYLHRILKKHGLEREGH